MTDNVAVLQGYTKEVDAEFQDTTLHLLIKPDTGLDDKFKAWDMEEQEFIYVNGWLCVFEEVKEV